MRETHASAPADRRTALDANGLSQADREAVRRVVDQAPPLGRRQREKLAAVLGSGARRHEREPVAA